MYRFETEVARGAKLFYLTGIRHGRYLKREILNLARFISVSKTKPLNWRLSHPYLIADRFEVCRRLHVCTSNLFGGFGLLAFALLMLECIYHAFLKKCTFQNYWDFFVKWKENQALVMHSSTLRE
jgi:hypothetical protein